MTKRFILLSIAFSSVLTLLGCSNARVAEYRTPTDCNSAACAADQCEVETPEQYYTAFIAGAKCNVHGLFGRVLRGRAAGDFETLSDDPSRKIIFLMDAQGLQTIMGHSTPNVLKQIGYTPEYIQSLYRDHYQFKLIIFKKYSGTVSSTWDNILTLIKQAYGPGIGKIIERQLPYLKSKSYGEIESMAPTKFAAVHERGKADPEYITDDKLLASKGELWKVRSFLYHQLRLTELFTGDGFTLLSDGTKDAPAFVMLNQRLADLPSPKVIILN